jgi:membrane protein YdbS with pleckstrin-like domain
MTHESPILSLEKPHPVLFTYYVITSILSGPALLFTLPYLYFRYHTLRYRFDQEGIHMKVGILFRREVNLTYARIQDIHLRSNLIQRWLGLANVEIQTASGSTGAELVIEGFKEFEAIRDFLYSRMRGVILPSGTRVPDSGPSATPPEAVSVLIAIRDELKRTRELLEAGRQSSSPGPHPPHG